MSIYLIVYYVRNMAACRDFYGKLGMTLEEGRHGDGPVHYAAKIGPTVFELYPAPDARETRTRLGLDFSGSGLISQAQEAFIRDCTSSVMDLGNGKQYAVVRDPNDNDIEIVW